MMLVSVTIADTKDYPYVIILEANAPELEVNDSMFYEISRNVVFPVNQYNIGKNSEVRKELTEDILPRFNNLNYRLDIMNIRGAASPEGPYSWNKILSERRLNSLLKIINDNSFRVELTINNQGTSEYNEDIVAKLYKHTYGNYGTLVETKTQTISLAQRRSVTIQFDLDNVMDGWQYFVKTYYYSSGYEVSLAGTSTHTINFPDEPTYRKGDVNGDGEVNIADINTIIDIILGRDVSISVQTRADVDGNNEINIADVNAVIDLILGN